VSRQASMAFSAFFQARWARDRRPRLLLPWRALSAKAWSAASASAKALLDRFSALRKTDFALPQRVKMISLIHDGF